MSASSHYTRHPALSERHFARLSTILTDANARYAAVAASVRTSVSTQRTHHARTRAQKLGLAVNVDAAVKCPQIQVSEQPLPVLERSSSPPRTVKKPQQYRGRPTLRVVVPPITTRATPTDLPSTGSISALSLSNFPDPVPAAAAPTTLRGQHVPWRGPTSRFSVTPSDVSLFSIIPYVPEQEVHSLFSVPPRAAPTPEEPPVVPEMLFEFSAGDEWTMELPPAPAPASGAADYAFSSSSYCASSSAGSTSTSSSRATSRGPVTPDDGHALNPFCTAPVSISVSGKRKGSAFLDEPSMHTVEKCPKYQRKSWVRERRLC